MALTALIIAFALAGLLLLIAAVRRLRRRRYLSGALACFTALACTAIAVSAMFAAANLRSFQRLGFEQSAGELQFVRTGERQYNAALTYPNGERVNFALRGEEWQVDAKMLKWRAFVNLLGFDAAYRLERISGRYTDIDDERTQAHTVYALHPPQRVEVWKILLRFHRWLPWLDALYGSATFLPMADGALYEIRVSQSGLIARPQNQAARDVVGGWR